MVTSGAEFLLSIVYINNNNLQLQAMNPGNESQINSVTLVLETGERFENVPLVNREATTTLAEFLDQALKALEVNN